MSTPARKRTLVETLRVLLEASWLDESTLGEGLRREGLHAAQLTAWGGEDVDNCSRQHRAQAG